MSKFQGNSDERMVELYQERIAGVKHEVRHGDSWDIRIVQDYQFFDNVEYRIQKQTRVINGITVPMCMTAKPEICKIYYTINVASTIWEDDTIDNLRLNDGVAFHTQSDAQLTMEAILDGTRL